MKLLLVLTLLAGCSTIPTEPMEPDIQIPEDEMIPETRYKVGDCGVLADYEPPYTSNPNDIFKIEKITPTHYIYRWWLGKQGWAIDVSSHQKIGQHKVLEKISKECKCPK